MLKNILCECLWSLNQNFGKHPESFQNDDKFPKTLKNLIIKSRICQVRPSGK